MAEARINGDRGRAAAGGGVKEAAANRAAWARWQDGLSVRFTLLDDLPPLRMLLILDNLAGHKSAPFVCWLMAHGIMPLYTPLSGSWLIHGRPCLLQATNR